MKRIAALEKQMQKSNLEALFVTNPVNVAYLSGFTGTSGSMLVTADQTCLLTDFRYLEQAGQQAPSCEIIDIAGNTNKQLENLLQAAGIGSLAVEADYLTVETFDKMGQALPGISLHKMASPVAELRRIKDEDEIRAIEAAQAITDAAFAHLLPQIRPGIRENELALELEFYMRRRGASGLSFEMIVASGERSSLPHGVASDKLLAAGDAVTLDFGCVVDGYCSDMTRTVFIGDPTPKQRMVYDAVLAAQEAALQQLRARITCRQGDAFARDVLTERDLAIYFGHSLGHGLGREIHEAPRLSPSCEDLLLPGMVVTVEPGVYLPGEFGVRIEDLVVITENGVRNLTKSTKELYCV